MAPRRIAHLLTLLTLLFAPLSLLTGTASAMPAQIEVSVSHPAAPGGQASHCDEPAEDMSRGKQDTGGAEGDCRVKCAVSCSTMPALDSGESDVLAAPIELPSARLVSALAGLAPEAADPPPRTA